jgi:hypothetical protein
MRGEGFMHAEEALDDLIRAGWQVIESDFDTEAFLNWRKRARDCVVILAGPDHPYAQFFDAAVAEGPTGSLLAGAGILEAIKEQLATMRFTSDGLDRQADKISHRDDGDI